MMKIKNFIPFLFLLNFAPAANSQPTNDPVKNIDDKLAKGEITISKVLADPSLMYLHSLTPFRSIIEKNARPEKIKLITDNEPGIKITVKGIVANKSGTLQVEKLIYVYQTSSQGWYSDTAPHILQTEGDRRHARLFGYFKTDSKGQFEFNTIKPNGYPNSTLPAHIHIEVYLNEDKTFISELLFDDDPRLVGEVRSRSMNEGFIIAKNTGTESNSLYYYGIKVSD